MNFEKTGTMTQTQELTPFDMEQTRAIIVQDASANMAEIQALTDEIHIEDMRTIVQFGKKAADEISKVADEVLRSVELAKINEVSNMAKALNRIMDTFDKKELSEKKGLFGNAKKQIERILSKYSTMGDEIEKIYIQLRQYEADTVTTNAQLQKQFDANVEYYKLLAKYIRAGEEGCRMIAEYRQGVEAERVATGDASLSFRIQSLSQAEDMLAQRVQDLRNSELIALQTIPMLRAEQVTNFNIARKVNSSFIITMPIFKQSIAEAVRIKKMKLTADALRTLDERTAEMLEKNAINATANLKETTMMVNSSTIPIEKIEQVTDIILNGIIETQRIQEECAKKRIADRASLIAQKEKLLSSEAFLPGGGTGNPTGYITQG